MKQGYNDLHILNKAIMHTTDVTGIIFINISVS